MVAPSLSVPLPLYDLSDLPPTGRTIEVQRLMAAEARRPFDLTRGPLMRACLLRLGPAEHVVLLVMHHIISDAWSMGVLIREVAAFYEGYLTGLPPPLPPLKLQYPDFALWQRSRLQGQVLAEQLAYWRRQLSGLEKLELPIDRPRPAVQTYSGAVYCFTITRELSERLKELSRRQDATLFMTLLAAFKALLARYTRQRDIVVGTPIAGRNHPDIENLIGFFVNTLALRTDLHPPGDAFREARRRVAA